MSLEAAIQDNTQAIRELIAAIAKGAISAPQAAAAAAVVTEKAQATAGAGKKSETAATASSQPGAKQAVQGKKADAPATAGEQAPQIAYDDVRKAVQELAKAKGREIVESLLQRHGAYKLDEDGNQTAQVFAGALKPEQYQQVLTDIASIQAGTYNPEEAEMA